MASLTVTGYSRARSGIISGNCSFVPPTLMNQLFLAKNKNEDSDLGWTADLKINLDKL